MIPGDGLCHRVRQGFAEVVGLGLAVDGDMLVGVSPVLVAAAKVDDHKGAVGVMCRDEAAARLASLQCPGEVCRGSGHYLEHAVGVLPGGEQHDTGAPFQDEGVYRFRFSHNW